MVKDDNEVSKEHSINFKEHKLPFVENAPVDKQVFNETVSEKDKVILELLSRIEQLEAAIQELKGNK
jgi:hypothetical protein